MEGLNLISTLLSLSWVDTTAACGLLGLVPEGIIRPVVSISTLKGYIFHLNEQFLNNYYLD